MNYYIADKKMGR